MASAPRPRRVEGGPGDALALLAVALRPPADFERLAGCLATLQQCLDDPEARQLAEDAARRIRQTRPDREYHRLFLGPSKPVAPPFESVYRDGLAFGPSAISFLEELREAGIAPAPDFPLPPDHMSLQLEYLAHLRLLSDQARGAGRYDEAAEWTERATGFVERRLGRWFPAFMERLEAGAPESPYTLLVRVAARVAGVERPGRAPRRT